MRDESAFNVEIRIRTDLQRDGQPNAGPKNASTQKTRELEWQELPFAMQLI